MSQILFVGGGLDSATGVSIGEITGFNDTTYAPSALDVQAGQASWAIFTCLDAAGAPTTVVAGQTWYGHFGWNFTNPYVTTNKMTYVRDSAGFPWVAILCNGGSPTFALYYNSGTGGAPVWTQIGGNWAMAQNPASPMHRLDIKVVIDGAGLNHSATVWNKEAQVATGTFAAAGFTNIRDMQIFAGGAGANHCMIWEAIMTEGQSTIGARVGYSLAAAAGSNAGWTGTFNLINPAVCTDATTNTSGVAAQKTTYDFGNIVIPASNTIRTAWQWIRGKNDGSNPTNIKAVCRSAGTDYPAAANSLGIGIAFGSLYATRFDVDPATGVAWTQVGFNAAEFGMLSAA